MTLVRLLPRGREGEGAGDMMLGDTTHLLPSGWPGWPMRPPESRQLLLPLKPISLVSPSLCGEQHRQTEKKKKSSWFSRAGAFRQWEQLGQTIIFSAQSGLPQITTGIITLLPPQRLGAPNGNLWWCVGNPSLLKIPECCVFDRNTSPLLVCFLSGEAQSVLLKCHYVLTSKHIIFILPFYSMLYQGKKFPVTALVWNLDLEMYIPVIVLLHLPLDTVNTIKMHLTTNLFFNFPSDWVKNWHVIIFPCLVFAETLTASQTLIKNRNTDQKKSKICFICSRHCEEDTF